MRCSGCGEDHALLDPAFARPDAVIALSADERRARVRESNDLCDIAGEAPRFFVRAVLPVELLDAADEQIRWGLWVEVAREAFARIVALWSDPAQGDEPPIAARIANRVRGYDDTLGLAVTLQLIDPETRPMLRVPADAIHPFAVECRMGVSLHRAAEWLARQV